MAVLCSVGSPKVRSSLLYDHTLTADQMSNSIRDVEQSVARMCQLSQVDVRPQLPALFTKLVRQMRILDARALSQLYNTSAPCEKAKYVSYMPMFMPSVFANSRSVAHSLYYKVYECLIPF